MAKGILFVVLYSIVLLSLFCVFCYLMTTVNPPPISSEISENEKAMLIEEFLPLREGILKFGLEKYHSKSDDDQRTTTTEPAFILLVPHKPTVHFESVCTSTDYLDLKKSIKKTTEEIVNPPEMPMVTKKEKRRSVNENFDSKSERAGAVILKIVNDIGKTKIEIKVEPDAFNSNDISDIEYYKNYKNKREYKNKETVIKILPNNTLTLAKPDSALLIDYSRKNTIISKKVTETELELSTASYTSQSILLRTLKNDKLVLFSATKSTEKYATKSH